MCISNKGLKNYLVICNMYIHNLLYHNNFTIRKIGIDLMNLPVIQKEMMSEVQDQEIDVDEKMEIRTSSAS
jgi:hypothetical protein